MKKIQVILLSLLLSVTSLFAENMALDLVINVDTTATICMGDSIKWHGIVGYGTGDYTREITRRLVKIVYTLHLTAKETPVTRISKTICEGDKEYFHGQLITESGIYRDTLKAVAACDSIVEWTFNIVPRDIVYVTHELEEGETYTWNGETYDTPGVYTYATTNRFGCDSITRLVLSGHIVDRVTRYDTICSGDSVVWHGIVGRDTHVYSNIETLPNGNFVIYTLNLVVKQPVYVTHSLSICTGDGQFFNGKYYDQAGTFHDTISCDTIYKVVVTRLPSHEYVTNAVFDGIEPYVWRYADKTKTVSQEGVLDENIYNPATGCSDHYHLELHKQVTATLRTVLFCDEITFKGQVYTSTSSVYDTLYMPNYVDSIIVTRLVKGEPFHAVESITLHQGETINWHGQLVNNEQTYYDTHQSVFGCDSTYELRVTLLPIENPQPIFTEQAEICDGSSYSWRGHDYSTTGIWKEIVPAVLPDTMDTTYMLNLTVHSVYDTAYMHLYSCAGDKITYNGKDYYNDTIFTTTYPTQYGCDSIIKTFLHFNPSYDIEYSDTICESELPYIFGKQNPREIRDEGTYSTTEQTVYGCDSSVTVHLYIKPSFNRNDSVFICESNISTKHPFVFHNLKYTQDTIIWNCNKTNYFHVIVRPQAVKDSTYYLCEHDTLHFGYLSTGQRQLITKEGTYYDTIRAASGWLDSQPHGGYHYSDTLNCDSIIKLTVFMRPADRDTTEIHIPQGDSIYWGGSYKHFSGFYSDSITDMPDKDSRGEVCHAIHTLHLFVDPTYYLRDTVDVCNVPNKTLTYKWKDGYKQTFTTEMTAGDKHYVDSLLTQHYHFDSIYDLFVRFNITPITYLDSSICYGDSIIWGIDSHSQPRYLSKQGVYNDTLRAINGCDSIIQLTLNIRPHYFFSDTVTIRDDQSHTWRGQTYAHSGVYYDSLTTQFGCDSVYQLVLSVLEKQFVERTLCQGEEFTFNDKTYTRDTLLHEIKYSGYGNGIEYIIKLHFRPVRTIDIEAKTSKNKPYQWNIEDTTYVFGYSGTYEHVLRTKDNQCDSIIYKLHLTVGSIYLFKDSAALCQSDLPYKWHNQLIYDVGIYYDSLQTDMGYDSVYMFKVLEILPAYYEERIINICEGAGAFYYRGKPYNQKGEFYDTIPSINGCDSIFKIIVRVMPTYEIYDTVHISDKETYPFYGRDLYVPGPYVHYGKTTAECDSIVHLQLYVHPSYLFLEEEEICNKDTFMWHGKPRYEEGVYYDSLLSVQGYDSVYKLTLKVYPTYFKEESIEICPNTTTWLHEINISEPGVYWDTLYSVHGCDSIFKITVNLKRSFRQEFDAEICQGEEYVFFGVPYSKNGTYKYEIGCDSIITMHLTVHPRDIVEKRVVISEEDLPYRYNGEEYWETKVYVDTFKNSHACDSIFKLNLVVTSHVSEWEQIPLCPGSDIRIDGQVITEAGQYTFLKRSKVTGLLDSLYRVEVYNAPAYETWDTVTVCQGDTVFFDGKPLTRGGAYTESKKTTLGCDSIRHLYLIFNPTYTFTTPATITDYQTCTWRGKEYSEPGTYYQTYPTIDFCDSTFVLELSVVPTQRIIDSTAICAGSSTIWRGRELSEPGIYNDTVCNLASLTSIIYSLKLTVVTPTIITKASITDVAADAESFNIDFTYSGLRPERYSITFDDLAHQQGFADIIDEPFGPEVVAVVPIPHFDKIAYKDHTFYVRPNNYTLRLALDNGVCGLSRSDSLTLLIRYPSWILEQNWDNVVVPLRKEYNGGYEFGNYAWYINDVPYDNNGSPYLYTNTLKRGDKVVLYATRVGESYAIPTAPLEIAAPQPDVFDNPVLVYPTSTSKAQARVKLKAETNGTYKVYNATGQLFSNGNFTFGEQFIEVPATSGCCFVQTTTDEGNITTTKIIVY